MNELKQQIKHIKDQFSNALDQVTTEQDLENIRILFLGRNGHIANLMPQLKNLPVEDKRTLGPLLNDLKNVAEEQYKHKQQYLAEEKVQQEQMRKHYFDVTAYKPDQLHGSLHIYTRIIEKIETIFISMGYAVADGPEAETDYYNFDALNIPADHPARDMHDTFWLDVPNMLMRTHTSTVQIHQLETKGVPIAMISPGRAYRNEATDASHDFMFTQVEGLLINKDVSLSNLLATTQNFLKNFFEKDISIRVRPGYFPFVEPGVEIDCSCPFCTTGCSTCKKTGWIELLGAGLVHPNVLQCCGIDPELYSGFAFGCGIERLAMIKYGINDIRLFHSSKISFLKQF